MTSNSDEMITISRAEYEAMQAQLVKCDREIDLLMEQLRLSKKEIFGSSSEKVREEVTNQLSLTFNTPHGAQTSAVIYSIIETAKENGLDPYHY